VRTEITDGVLVIAAPRDPAFLVVGDRLLRPSGTPKQRRSNSYVLPKRRSTIARRHL